MAVTDEEFELFAHVRNIVEQVKMEGRRTHSPESWLDESIEHHLYHAQAHMTAYAAWQNEKDLKHALTRLAMAHYLYAKSQVLRP